MTVTRTTAPPKSASSKIPLDIALHDLYAGLRQLYGPRTPRVVLYGSYARGEAHAESDIDVLLIFPDPTIRPGAEITHLSYLLADLNLRYEILVSVVPTTQHQYQTADEPFWKNVRREGIEIYERSSTFD